MMVLHFLGKTQHIYTKEGYNQLQPSDKQRVGEAIFVQHPFVHKHKGDGNKEIEKDNKPNLMPMKKSRIQYIKLFTYTNIEGVVSPCGSFFRGLCTFHVQGCQNGDGNLTSEGA